MRSFYWCIGKRYKPHSIAKPLFRQKIIKSRTIRTINVLKCVFFFYFSATEAVEFTRQESFALHCTQAHALRTRSQKNGFRRYRTWRNCPTFGPIQSPITTNDTLNSLIDSLWIHSSQSITKTHVTYMLRIVTTSLLPFFNYPDYSPNLLLSIFFGPSILLASQI